MEMNMKYKNEIIIFLVSCLFYLLFNDKIPITDPVEANYALTAKEMFLQSDYLNLIIYGQYWYDKPIFIYWSLLISYAIFGINTFAARLPMALASGLTLSYVYWFVKRIYPIRFTALISVLILATSLEYWVISKMVLTDSFLFLFDGVALGSFYLAITEKNNYCLYLAYAASAMAVLTKGPVGIVLPFIIILVFLLLTSTIKDIRFIVESKGSLLFIAIALPWYVYMYIMHGQAFIDGFLGLHNLTRALVAEHPKDNLVFYYFVIFPVALFPWSLIFARQVWHSLCNRRNVSRIEIYLYTWIAVTIGFYTLVATKYLTYIYIALFPAVILIAIYLNNTKVTYKQIYWDTMIPLLLLISGVVSFMININRLDQADNFVIAYIAIFMLIVFLIYLKWQVREKTRMLCGLLGCNILLIVIATGWIIPYYAQSRSSADLADYFHNNAVTASFGDYQTSTLFYHTGKLIRIVNDESSEVNQDIWRQKNMMPTQSVSEFTSAISNEETVYMIVSKKNYEEFKALPLSKLFFEINSGRRDIILKKR